jgi:hypothetical protein
MIDAERPRAALRDAAVMFRNLRGRFDRQAGG